MLDESGTRPPEAALRLLELILEQDEKYAPAYVELARFALKSSFQHTYGGIDRFTDDGQAAALALLDRASELEPEFADTWVLFGYVLPAIERNMLGLIALDRAEQLQSDSQWLPYNRARIQAAIGDLNGARRSYLAARELVPQGSPTHLNILAALTSLSETAEEEENYHKELLHVAPDSPYVRGNYSDFLIREGRFDDAIEFARTALRIRVYPRLVGGLALAIYAKAADLELKGDRVNAGALFVQAQQVGYPVERVLHDATSWPATHHVVFALARRGVDLDAPMPFGRTVLFQFVANGTVAQVRELLTLGADPNARDEGVGTPLHTAIAIKSPEHVLALLEAGADPAAEDNHNVAAFELALRWNRPDIAEMLEQAMGAPFRPDWMPMVEGIRGGNAAAIREAIHFLQTQDPENVGVLTALQESIAEIPSTVLPLTSDYGGVMVKICGHPIADDQSVSIERRLEAVEKLFEAAGPVPPLELVGCRSTLRRAQTEPPRPSIPHRPTPEERPALLARATELFRQAEPNDWRLGEAERIVRALVRSDPSDVAVNVLAVRIDLAQAKSMASHRGTALEVPSSTVDQLERALLYSPSSAEILELYGRVLAHEGRVALSDLVAAKAGITLDAPDL
jgi:tetratricopeptide (TPR) repeat protein